MNDYNRDCAVVVMYGLNKDWSAARAYSDLPGPAVCQDLSDIIHSGIVAGDQLNAFKYCLEGEMALLSIEEAAQ